MRPATACTSRRSSAAQATCPSRSSAAVTLFAGDGGPKITKVHLVTEGRVPGIDQATFQKFAEGAKAGCPVSKLLAPGVEAMTLEATLV